MSNISSPLNEIHYVYIGSHFPQYAKSSLKLSKRHSGLNPVLITNSKFKRMALRSKIDVIAIEDFYEAEQFYEASKRIGYNHEFRGGFWLRTLERFFVLEQFLKISGKENLLHAELDQLTFRIDVLVKNLECRAERGMFLPFHSTKAGIASIAYVNDHSALKKLVDFASTTHVHANEMSLLANWSKNFSKSVFALPTIAKLETMNRTQVVPNEIQVLNENEIGGLVDAAQIGQWIGGVDPRNVPINKIPTNQFVDLKQPWLLTREQLTDLNFIFNESQSTLHVKSNLQEDLNLFNIHLHSKIHHYLARDNQRIAKMFENANSGKTSAYPGTRKTQITEYARSKIIYLIKNPSKIYRYFWKMFYTKFGSRFIVCSLVTSDGLISPADIEYEGQDIDWSKFKDLDTIRIVCRKELLNHLLGQGLTLIEKVFILVIKSDVALTDRDLLPIVQKIRKVKIFAQNYIGSDQRIVPIPIGIQSTDCLKLKKQVSKLKEDIYHEVAWRFDMNDDETERLKISELIGKNKLVKIISENSKENFLEVLGQSRFVIVNPSNSFDNELIWLAIYLKCIPIVLSSPPMIAFVDQGLPIWIIDDFDVLQQINENILDNKYAELYKGFNSELLSMHYWRNLIYKY